MQYYRCKCGKHTSMGSMPPAPCTGCEECGTTLARHPDGHRTPDEHQPVKRYHEVSGEPFMMCSRCMKRLEQPEETGER